MRGFALPLLALLVATTLAGCARAPDVPEDALTAVQPGLDGLTLSAWVEQRGGYTYLRAVVENGGSVEYDTKEDCGYLWQSELRGADGVLHAYKQPSDEGCDWFYDFLRPGDHREFLHSWDGRFWNGTKASDAQAWDAPTGDYEWTVRFLLRDGADHDTLEPVAGRYVELVVPLTLT